SVYRVYMQNWASACAGGCVWLHRLSSHRITASEQSAARAREASLFALVWGSPEGSDRVVAHVHNLGEPPGTPAPPRSGCTGLGTLCPALCPVPLSRGYSPGVAGGRCPRPRARRLHRACPALSRVRV